MNVMTDPGADRARKVVVIGAGPGGLASAMLLRAAGAEVTVLERADRVGGRTASFTQDGFTFDYGPTFYLYPTILREIFGACGHGFLDPGSSLPALESDLPAASSTTATPSTRPPTWIA